jgi:hypothetical protein
MNDTINTLIKQGLEIGTGIAGNDSLINGVDNGIVGSVISIVTALIIRFIEKRKLRKQGKLTDK